MHDYTLDASNTFDRSDVREWVDQFRSAVENNDSVAGRELVKRISELKVDAIFDVFFSENRFSMKAYSDDIARCLWAIAYTDPDQEPKYPEWF